jgi:hypothetical protein
MKDATTLRVIYKTEKKRELILKAMSDFVSGINMKIFITMIKTNIQQKPVSVLRT